VASRIPPGQVARQGRRRNVAATNGAQIRLSVAILLFQRVLNGFRALLPQLATAALDVHISAPADIPMAT
jgi:hypothetical protein